MWLVGGGGGMRSKAETSSCSYLGYDRAEFVGGR